METKVCRLCKKELDKSLFYKRKDSADGLTNECKNCTSVRNKKWRYDNPDKAKACARVWGNTHTEKANARSKAWNEAHPEKTKATSRAWYVANTEKANSRSRARYDADPKKVNARIKAWRNAHPDKVKAYTKVWAKNHPEVTRAISQTRRSRKAELPSTLTLEQWEYCKDYFDCRCAYCGCGDKKLHQEHFIALSKGGGYEASNIIAACGSCNYSKGAKDFFEFYPTFKHYSKAREDKILEFLHYVGTAQQLIHCT